MAFRCHQRSQLLALGAAVPMDLQLGVNLIHILLDGSFREVELLRNFPVTHPFGCPCARFQPLFLSEMREAASSFRCLQQSGFASPAAFPVTEFL